MSKRTDMLLEVADAELILGWRNSEWTGIAPFLEEDVAFSSIAQNEIGHARALYELAAAELGTTPDEVALDRKAAEEPRPPPPVPRPPPGGAGGHPPPLALRDGRRDPTRRDQGVRRPRDRGRRGED